MIEICKNIHSKEYFIFINQDNEDKLLLVTPENKIRVLEENLFEDPIDGEIEYFIERGLISESQVQTYQNYNENRKLDRQEASVREYEDWSKEEIEAYIKRLEERREELKKNAE